MDVTTAIRRLQLHATYADDDEVGVAAVLADVLAFLQPIERRAVIRHAYWRMPEITTAALCRAVGGKAQLHDQAGRGPLIGCCACCGRGIRAGNRDTMAVSHRVVCRECEDTAESPAMVLTPPDFGWEFERPPQPWRPPEECAALVGQNRRWAEEYPSPEVA